MFIFTAFLVLCTYCAFIFAGYKRTNDLFCPCCFLNILSFVYTVPHLFLMDYTKLQELKSDYDYYLLYILLLILFNALFTLFSIYVWNKPSICLRENHKQEKLSAQSCLILFVIGCISTAYIFYSSGGLLAFWQNMMFRTRNLAGKGWLLVLRNSFFILAVEFMLSYCAKKEGKLRLVILESIMLVFAGCFGDRSSIMMIVMVILLTYNYSGKRITAKAILKIKNIVVLFLILSFLVVIPALRTAEINSEFIEKPIDTIILIVESRIGNVGNEIKWIDRDIFTIAYFTQNQHWWGASYLDLIYAPIPHSMLKTKPVVDDGVYLANLMRGEELKLGASSEDISFLSSVPFTNIGILYANFGILGIIFGSILFSYIMSWGYAQFLKVNKSSISILLYFVFIYRFDFTNLHMVSFLSTLLFILIFNKMVSKKLE